MARTNWEILMTKLVNGERLPKWANQDLVMRALKEIADDLECGLLKASVIGRHSETLQTTARRFRCLECFERLIPYIQI